MFISVFDARISRDPEQLLTVSKVQFTPDWEGTVADHGTWRVALGRIGHEHVWR
jgi:predicted metal-dependent enzyme (double-stranded beta helix superfamily)